MLIQNLTMQRHKIEDRGDLRELWECLKDYSCSTKTCIICRVTSIIAAPDATTTTTPAASATTEAVTTTAQTTPAA